MAVTYYSHTTSQKYTVSTTVITGNMPLTRSGDAIPSGATISKVTFTMTADLFTPVTGFYLLVNAQRIMTNNITFSSMTESNKAKTWELPVSTAAYFTNSSVAFQIEGRNGINDYPSLAEKSLLYYINSGTTLTFAITWTAPSACGAPTSATVSPTIAEADPTLSWSGAASGDLNAISSYEIEYCDSENNSTFGSWTALKTVTTTATSGSTTVTIPGTRGYYRKLRIRVRGAAGASYYSPWKESNTVRKNTLPSAPTSVVASPSEYYTEIITLAFSGAAGGSSAIQGYRIVSRTSTNGSDWGSWSTLADIVNSASSGSYTPPVSKGSGTYTQFGVNTIDTLGVMSTIATSNSILCSVSAAGAPTTCGLSVTLTEANTLLSWSGASPGADNSIMGFEVQSSDSSDNTTWGAWAAYSIVSTTATSGSLTISAPTTRGYYRRFRVRTQGAAGSSYYSDWIISSNNVRKNILATSPTTVTATPSIFEGTQVLLTFSGATAGTSAIKQYIIQRAMSDDGSSWNSYTDCATVTTNSTSGYESVVASNIPGQYVRFRIAIVDAVGGQTAWVTSNTVQKSLAPATPIIVTPTASGKTYNKMPRILIKTGGETDGRTQKLYAQIGSGTLHNCVTDTERFTVSGNLTSGTQTIYKSNATFSGGFTVKVYAEDSSNGQQSTTASRSFSVLANPFTTITANVTKASAAQMNAIRTAVNNVRAYYSLSAVVWKDAIISGRTPIRDWPVHIKEIRTAIQQVVDLINAFDPVTTFDVPSFSWQTMSPGRPRAAIMKQITDLILTL